MKTRSFAWQSLVAAGISLGLVITLITSLEVFSLKPGRSQVLAAPSSYVEKVGGKAATAHAPARTAQNKPAAAETNAAAASAILSEANVVNVHQLATLEQWLRTPQEDPAAAQQQKEPYLLADYAAQCQAYMGEVPEFSCIISNSHPNVADSKELTVDVSTGVCPRIGIDERCVLTNTVEGRLKPTVDAPNVTTLFSCRRYDSETPKGRYDDIAVIQHDIDTGNTCWFQSPVVYAFDNEGNTRKDRFGYTVYEDWPGDLVPSPMSYGAHNYWLHPYHPDDVIGRNYVADMRAGRRGVVADQNCQRCHDADPFVWTPYLRTIHVVNDATPPTGWNPLRNYVSNFLGLFNADGKTREQALSLTLDGNDCEDCHRFGEFTMSREKQAPEGSHGNVVALLARVFSDTITTTVGVRWMPPTVSIAYPALSPELRNQLHDCAEGKAVTGCTKFRPPPTARANLTVETEVAPAILVAGHDVRYTILLNNTGVSTPADTATGLVLSNILPAGVTPLTLPDDCTSAPKDDRTVVTCTIGDMANLATKTVSFTAHVGVGDYGDTLTNTVEIITSQDATALNIATIRVRDANPVRRDADLALGQVALLEAAPGAGPPAFLLKYSLTVANNGPAVAGGLTLSQVLPAGAVYDDSLSSERCEATAGLVSCTLGDLDDGRSSTIQLFATVPQASGPFFTNSASVSAAAGSPDPSPANNSLARVLFDRAAVQQHYLPLVMQPHLRGPDLVVKSIQITAEGAQVVIQNIGESPVGVEDGFWVDLYINPNPPPSGVNQTLEQHADDGWVWGAIPPPLPLAPGDEYTLSIGDRYYVHGRSSVPRRIEAGAVIYVQVDSANVHTDYGGVLEAHEVDGGVYNNINSLTLAETVSTRNWVVRPAAVEPAANSNRAHHPRRN